MKPKVIEQVWFGNKGFEVVQQPENDPGWVSGKAITQFRMAMNGLLAHNNKIFLGLKPLDYVVCWSGGVPGIFQVEQVLRYQALTPNSPHSAFIELGMDDLQLPLVLSAAGLFDLVYRRYDLVLQTCITKMLNNNWGRQFVCCNAAPDPWVAGERRDA